MTEKDASTDADWLRVIGRALAYLCVQEAERREPKKFDTVLKKVKFLEGLGLSRSEAAGPAGSSADSVSVMHSRSKKAKAKHGKSKKSRRSR
ncbi:MAG: hypothetical protein GEU95_02510 [Rhizobiales bacterium]|nr:hypothetical protein [Hyphomicrobiales bacterium]